MIRRQFAPVLLLISLLISFPLLAEVRLPRHISDGTVWQRDVPLTIWGWAEPGETVRVTFLGEGYTTRTGSDGDWSVELPPQSAGGPHTMTIRGENTLVSRAGEYAELFTTLIRDWRAGWRQGDFPFIGVQLANFLPALPFRTDEW